MGHVKIDTQAKSREYSVTYTLSDPKGVAKLLRDRHRIAERRFHGDYDASDILIDLHSAIESANLTERQAEAIAWYHGMDLTLEDTGAIMGCEKQSVRDCLTGAYKRIAKIYREWNERSNGESPYEITLTYELDDEDEETAQYDEK